MSNPSSDPATKDQGFVIKTKPSASPLEKPKPGRKKLIRPRGKRGGIKHRKASERAVVDQDKKVKRDAKASSSSSSSTTQHSERIAAFHTLEKELARATDPDEVERIRNEQKKLGGLESYQDDSLKGGDRLKGGESGKWCAQTLTQLLGDEKRTIKLLDVGAIAGTSYAKFESWIKVTSIDLNPRAEHVEKYDFFDYPLPSSEGEKFDVVGLSLVVNFIGDLYKRGSILHHSHSYLKPKGYLYLVLPLPCLTNSRYLNHDHLRSILSSCGFDVVKQDDSLRLTRWLLQRKDRPNDRYDGTVFKKKEIVPGVKRNNFCILLDPSRSAPSPSSNGATRSDGKAQEQLEDDSEGKRKLGEEEDGKEMEEKTKKNKKTKSKKKSQ
ncbi:hypothetical protein IE53DRAFT_334795 [Violaceomyces palustris]|uniref:Uncharacterized protein n=1 Tax=Violaceomyces palustris TaxID=1673888 RepID=A0ACD0NPW5_9BASI|nr:hypothetical protein IE53DRAFT_334795 [Violaceomyces palustris]